MLSMYTNKDSKNFLKNYRPISLLPLFIKILEKDICNSLYSYFECNNMLYSCKSGFREQHSSVSQLLFITHEIYRHFDANPSIETRAVFDKVLHEGLLFKLKSHRLLTLIVSFWRNRFKMGG